MCYSCLNGTPWYKWNKIVIIRTWIIEMTFLLALVIIPMILYMPKEHPYITIETKTILSPGETTIKSIDDRAEKLSFGGKLKAEIAFGRTASMNLSHWGNALKATATYAPYYSAFPIEAPGRVAMQLKTRSYGGRDEALDQVHGDKYYVDNYGPVAEFPNVTLRWFKTKPCLPKYLQSNTADPTGEDALNALDTNEQCMDRRYGTFLATIDVDKRMVHPIGKAHKLVRKSGWLDIELVQPKGTLNIGFNFTMTVVHNITIPDPLIIDRTDPTNYSPKWTTLKVPLNNSVDNSRRCPKKPRLTYECALHHQPERPIDYKTPDTPTPPPPEPDEESSLPHTPSPLTDPAGPSDPPAEGEESDTAPGDREEEEESEGANGRGEANVSIQEDHYYSFWFGAMVARCSAESEYECTIQEDTLGYGPIDTRPATAGLILQCVSGALLLLFIIICPHYFFGCWCYPCFNKRSYSPPDSSASPRTIITNIADKSLDTDPYSPQPLSTTLAYSTTPSHSAAPTMPSSHETPHLNRAYQVPPGYPAQPQAPAAAAAQAATAIAMATRADEGEHPSLVEAK